MSYNNPNDLIKAIKSKLKEVAKDEVIKTIKSTEMKHIDEDLYEAYTPYGSNPYDRRYENKGMADPSNINIDIQDIDNGVNITTTNTTKANGDDYGELLTPLIEEGIYHWSHKPPKRKFIEETAKDLKDNSLVEQALKQGLRKRGINTK